MHYIFGVSTSICGGDQKKQVFTERYYSILYQRRDLILLSFALCRSDDEVGHTTILLRDLLEAQDGAVFERILHASGAECIGHDLQPTLLTISCTRVDRFKKRAKFQQPSLDASLQQSDGYMLRPLSSDSSFSSSLGGFARSSSGGSRCEDQQGAGYRFVPTLVVSSHDARLHADEAKQLHMCIRVLSDPNRIYH